MNMTRDKIKTLALANGFTERQQADGSMDLNGYVYAFAEAMHAEGQRAMRERAAKLCDGLHYRWHFGDDDTDSGPSECAAGVRALEVKP